MKIHSYNQVVSFILFFFFMMLTSCETPAPIYTSLEDYPVYEGSDLGLTYSPQVSQFKIWSPAAEAVDFRVYEAGVGGAPIIEEKMLRGDKGTWHIRIPQNLKGKFYTFQIFQDGKWWEEVPDPCAKAVGVNGQRAMVINLAETHPKDWDKDQRPPLKNPTDIILYELHFRDISVHPNSGIRHKGKFLGLAETGTTTSEGIPTGLDHIKEMGVTHVHLLPSYDYLSIDESKLEKNQFNWGYDPQNYNVPEGSYSTNPHDGAVRIREFKQMVKSLHDNGLRVILDVVYNHTGKSQTSHFNQMVPAYYYRQDEKGGFSNASACGNETASERAMMRKFMIESVKYWIEEYHLDGFRFDLMGIHDIETMNAISEALHQIDPTIFIYGEGWTAGDSPLAEEQRALKKHTYRLNNIAAFSDDLRDGVKGHVFTPTDRGFASGKQGAEESVKFGIVAATQHPQIKYDLVNYSKLAWAKEPFQCINYVSCHDNHTLWDRINHSNPDFSEADRIKMHQLANTIVLTSQGIPFLHAGVEMLRSKNGVENSFESPDSINQIDWSRKKQYKEVVEYHKGLIRLRKNHPAFRMPSKEMIQNHLRFLPTKTEGLIAYLIENNANEDHWTNILVILNGNFKEKMVDIPKGEWVIVVEDGQVNESGISVLKNKATVKVKGSSAMVLYNI